MAMMRKDQFFGKSDDDDERERNKWTLKKTNNVKKKKKKSPVYAGHNSFSWLDTYKCSACTFGFLDKN